jgi:hypothetical protein
VYLADSHGLGARPCAGANVAFKATHTGTTTEKKWDFLHFKRNPPCRLCSVGAEREQPNIKLFLLARDCM